MSLDNAKMGNLKDKLQTLANLKSQVEVVEEDVKEVEEDIKKPSKKKK